MTIWILGELLSIRKRLPLAWCFGNIDHLWNKERNLYFIRFSNFNQYLVVLILHLCQIKCNEWKFKEPFDGNHALGSLFRNLPGERWIWLIGKSVEGMITEHSDSRYSTVYRLLALAFNSTKIFAYKCT